MTLIGPPPGIVIDTIVSMPFAENTYVFSLVESSACIVFDPGLQPGDIIRLLEERRLAPAAILCTHGHSDHIAGNEALKKQWPEAPLVIGAGDAWKLTDPEGNLSAMFGISLISPEADSTVAGGDTYEAADMTWQVIDTPGHSGGHVAFVLSHEGKKLVVGGDVLFRGGIGRTDFPDADFETLRRSIHEKLFTLEDDVIVYPGHGEPTTIGEERLNNPFVGVAAGYTELLNRP